MKQYAAPAYITGIAAIIVAQCVPSSAAKSHLNRDNKPDLVWVSHFGSERAQVWLGDGLGHFLGGAYKNADSRLRMLLFGDPNPAVAGTIKDEQDILTPDPVSTEFARAANLEPETCKPLLIATGTDRRDLGLYLSYLRKRGPPQHTSSV